MRHPAIPQSKICDGATAPEVHADLTLMHTVDVLLIRTSVGTPGKTTLAVPGT